MPRPPVILIHGCNGSWRHWLAGWLQDADFLFGMEDESQPRSMVTMHQAKTWWHPARADVFALDYSDCRGSLSDLMPFLQKLIDFVRGQTQSEGVVLVAHSMGGILARAYIQSLNADYPYQDDVVGLYTIASPHNGARLVGAVGMASQFVASRLCPQAKDMHPLSGVVQYLNSRPLPGNIALGNFTAMSCRSRLFGFHDGVLYADDTLLLSQVAGRPVPGVVDGDSQHSVRGNRLCHGHQGAIPKALPYVEDWYNANWP